MQQHICLQKSWKILSKQNQNGQKILIIFLETKVPKEKKEEIERYNEQKQLNKISRFFCILDYFSKNCVTDNFRKP